MKMVKKIGAIVLAIMMIAMAGTAWADLGTDSNKNDETTTVSSAGVQEGTYHSTNKTYAAISPATVTFKKDIVIFNGSSTATDVFLPNIKYQYTIAAAGSNAVAPDITDEFGKKAVVNDGVLTTTKGAVVSITSKTIAFSNTNGITGDSTNNKVYVTTTKDGAVAEGTASFTFDPTKYEHAGIYRYKITESLADSSATRPQAGIYNTGYNTERYLDVYVKNDKDGSNNDTFSIYGFVMFDAASADQDWDAAYADLSHKEDSTNAYAGKTDGFTANITDETGTTYDPAEPNVDMYYTYNLNITKTTTGDLADKTHEFPFAARITNATITSGAKFSYKENGNASTGILSGSTPATAVTMTASGVGEIGTFNSNAADSKSAIKLKDGENLYIYGIPAYAKQGSSLVTTPVQASALVSEYNDTYDIYKVKIEYTDATNTSKKTDTTWDGAAPGASMAANSTSATTYTDFKVDYEDSALIEFTNIMESVSPTGYVTRFAPYALILVAGIVLLIIATKHKKNTDED